MDYSDSEDEVSYGQFGNSFYTNMEPDEDLLKKQEFLFGSQETNDENTLNPDITVENLS